MKSIKICLIILFGIIFSTCQKGTIIANIDLKGDWEWTEEAYDCPCHMLYLKRDTVCHFSGYPALQTKIIKQNDTLFFEYYGGLAIRLINIKAVDRFYKRGEKLYFFKNWVLDVYNTPPRYASTEAIIINENLINYKIFYYDDVTKTGAYGLVRYTGVQEVNLRRIKKK